MEHSGVRCNTMPRRKGIGNHLGEKIVAAQQSGKLQGRFQIVFSQSFDREKDYSQVENI